MLSAYVLNNGKNTFKNRNFTLFRHLVYSSFVQIYLFVFFFDLNSIDFLSQIFKKNHSHLV